MMKSRYVQGAALLFGLCLGCDESVSNEPASSERGPLGKADAPGSCESEERRLCGGRSAGACWCDESCVDWGDCCPDYEAVCLEATPEPVACEVDDDCSEGVCFLGLCSTVEDSTIGRSSLGLPPHPSDPGLGELVDLQAHWTQDRGFIIGGSLRAARDQLGPGHRGLVIERRDGAWTANVSQQLFAATDRWTFGDRGGFAGPTTRGIERWPDGFACSFRPDQEPLGWDVELDPNGIVWTAMALRHRSGRQVQVCRHGVSEVLFTTSFESAEVRDEVVLHMRSEAAPDVIVRSSDGRFSRWRDDGFGWERASALDAAGERFGHDFTSARGQGVTHLMSRSSSPHDRGAPSFLEYVRVTDEEMTRIPIEGIEDPGRPLAMDVDAAGNAYALVTSPRNFEGAPGYDVHVVRFSPTGEQTEDVIGVFENLFVLPKLAVSPEGTVFVVWPKTVMSDFEVRTVSPLLK